MLRKIGVVVLLLVALAAWLLVYPDLPVEELKQKYANEASRFVDVNGAPVHYRDEGPAEAPALLLIHGTAASLHTWDAWVGFMSEELRLIRLDLPGHGLTGPAAQADFAYTYGDYADFLEDFAAQLDLKRFALAGNSLGGAIAWVYALKHPERLSHLILIDAAGYPRERSPPIFALARTPVAGELLRYVSPPFLIERNLRQVYHDDSLVSEALVRHYHDILRRSGNRGALLTRIRGDAPAPYERLSEIETPTLILWGRHDTWIPVKYGERFAEDIPDSQLAVYENAGHVPMEELPGPTAADTLKFVLAR